MNEIKKISDNHDVVEQMKLYITIPEVLQEALSKQKTQQVTILATKNLPQKLQNFSEENDVFFSRATTHSIPVISERIWGIRCGTKHIFDQDHCSFEEVVTVARTNPLLDIYSPGIMVYYSNGDRSFSENYVATYNTQCNLKDYQLIGMDKALNLFPKLKNELMSLPEHTMFLTDFENIKIANQEEYEIGLNFDLQDITSIAAKSWTIPKIGDMYEYIPNNTLFFGNLRPTFAYLAQKIQAGETADLCDFSCKKEIPEIGKTIYFIYGSLFEIKNALKVVNKNDEISLKKDYSNGIYYDTDGSMMYILSREGKYCKPDKGDIIVYASHKVYQKWSAPFTEELIECLKKSHKFEFIDIKDLKPNDIKINCLRYTSNDIKINCLRYTSSEILKHLSLKKRCIERLSKNRLSKWFNLNFLKNEELEKCCEPEEQPQLPILNQEDRKVYLEFREELLRASARAQSSPSRSSLMTRWAGND